MHQVGHFEEEPGWRSAARRIIAKLHVSAIRPLTGCIASRSSGPTHPQRPSAASGNVPQAKPRASFYATMLGGSRRISPSSEPLGWRSN
jgi:hypothetical protein